MDEFHTMDVVATIDNEVTEFLCPTCGRRIAIPWGQTEAWSIVLEKGDETVRHVGGQGGVSMTTMDVIPED